MFQHKGPQIYGKSKGIPLKKLNKVCKELFLAFLLRKISGSLSGLSFLRHFFQEIWRTVQNTQVREPNLYMLKSNNLI
jgi:hypothetical protein